LDFGKRLQELEERGLRRETWPVDSCQGALISIQGRPFINFASNNYLGLAQRGEVREAAEQAIRDFGWGSGASRLMSGTHRLHEELEARLATLKRTEAALLFPSGYAANVGALPALSDERTRILSDELNHASLIDGIRLARGEVTIYPHADTEALEAALAQQEDKALVVSDGVFSMDGDVAPLREMVTAVERQGGVLYLDDAHGTGVLGTEGRGTSEHFGVSSASLLQMGTLSKALGGIGGFIAGDRDVIAYLRSRARSFIFSTALPAPACAAGIAALEILEREGGHLRDRLDRLCRYLAVGLERLGLVADPMTPIFPVHAGSVERCVRVSAELRNQGIFGPAIRPPTVPAEACRIRISLTADHEASHVDRLLDVLGMVL